MTTGTEQRRNPGPSWGYRFLLASSLILPRWILAPLLWLGSAVAVLVMPSQRQASTTYLQRALGRQPGFRDNVRHFYTFAQTLIITLRAGHGKPHPVKWAPGEGEEFTRVAREHGSVLFGAFHIGHADLLGYLLSHLDKRVWMVRVRVENSDDTRLAGKTFGEHVSFLWVNEPENLIFAVKDAMSDGESVALKCDRVEGARKTARFNFLGAEREFPVTIYHLAVLFQVPVCFAFGWADAQQGTEAYAPPVFIPRPEARKADEIARGQAHFAEVLRYVEAHLRRRPYSWFNFEQEKAS